MCFVHFEIDGTQISSQLYSARVWDTRLEFGQCCVFVEIREIFTQKRNARMSDDLLDCRGLNAIRCVAKCYFLHFNGNCRLDSGLE